MPPGCCGGPNSHRFQHVSVSRNLPEPSVWGLYNKCPISPPHFDSAHLWRVEEAVKVTSLKKQCLTMKYRLKRKSHRFSQTQTCVKEIEWKWDIRVALLIMSWSSVLSDVAGLFPYLSRMPQGWLVAFHQGANIAHQHCINLRYALRTGGRIPIVQPGTIAHHTRTYGGFLSLSCTLYSSPLALMNLDYVIARMTSWPALSNYCVLDSVLTSSHANTSWFFIRVCPISVHMTKFQLNWNVPLIIQVLRWKTCSLWCMQPPRGYGAWLGFPAMRTADVELWS